MSASSIEEEDMFRGRKKDSVSGTRHASSASARKRTRDRAR